MSNHRDNVLGAGNTGRHGSDEAASGAGGVGRRGPISGLVRAVAGGMGFASESIHHHKEKKDEKKKAAAAAEGAQNEVGESSQAGDGITSGSAVAGGEGSKQVSQDEPISSDSDEDAQEASPELDEAAWQLDDAQTELEPPPDYATATEDDADDMARRFISNHQIRAKPPSEKNRLPVPVIVPQRRPGERARGFIHAYAPVLENAGIDQPTFMDFIKQLNLATRPSPWIHAINVASVAVQNVPEPITIAVAISAQIATQVGLQAHSRSKTNAFLNKINAEFFRPLGLIAVILTWKPSRSGEVVSQARFDAAPEQAADSVSGPGQGTTGRMGKRMQASNATTNFEWPETAPLVFPDLDKMAGTAQGRNAVEKAAKQPNSVKRGMLFAMEYMDKRGQAQFAKENPGSGLANLGVKPEFHSRYSDPNHPASSGSLIALLTGGAATGRISERNMARRERRAERHDQRTDRRSKRGPTILGTVGPGALIRGVKKFMHEDVLYLMIANLPSTEQLAAAQTFLGSLPPTMQQEDRVA
ncbi:hypothetical protein J3458_013377 [Metarhizium acridum]|uniref:uncharacterized protein n=1 Tax=Metarhizium acridum TaxID=92637 RepID=UPI001C6CCD52|nr:hypothetical protein J3458_013377 [Metarhizium acridum]